MTPSAPAAMAREWVLACIDNSAYTNSVCDHAGWFASHPEVGVEILHVVDAEEDGGDDASHRQLTVSAGVLIRRAVGRLLEEGVGPITSAATTGSFVDIAVRHQSGPIVVGKRGAGRARARGRLGSRANAIINDSDKPVCLAPQVFLPIHRALVILDAERAHLRTLKFIASDFRLSALPLSVAVLAKPGESPDAKVECARNLLTACSADIFPLVSASVDEAVAQCMETRGSDMIILSREVASGDLEAEMIRMEERGLWATRTPVLIG